MNGLELWISDRAFLNVLVSWALSLKGKTGDAVGTPLAFGGDAGSDELESGLFFGFPPLSILHGEPSPTANRLCYPG